MTSLLKKLSIFIKIGVIKRYGVCLVSFKIVDRIRRGSRRELVANCVHSSHRRRDSSRRRRCVLGCRHGQQWRGSTGRARKLSLLPDKILFPPQVNLDWCHWQAGELPPSPRSNKGSKMVRIPDNRQKWGSDTVKGIDGGTQGVTGSGRGFAPSWKNSAGARGNITKYILDRRPFGSRNVRPVGLPWYCI